MSGNFDLDVRNADDVSSHSVLRADLGEGRSLVVISGIARPEWRLDTDQAQEADCVVRFHEPATHIVSSTVFVGLASFSNEETEFVYATNKPRVANEGGELVLHVNLALAGEPSTLNRFGYQVVLVDHALATEISGTLTWPTAWFRPASEDPTLLAAAFIIDADEPVPGTGGQDALNFLARGEIVAVTITDGSTAARYRIRGVPTDRNIRVVVTQHALQPPGDAGARMAPATFDGDMVRLTAAQPTKANVDFVAVRVGGPA